MKMPQFTPLRGITLTQLRQDLIAALVVTAIAIPESLAFAGIVGLPLQTGLYCALLAPIVFALLTSSKHLVVGADSATAALVASGAATLAMAGTNEYANAVAVVGMVTGIILIGLSAARFGFLADLISRPVFVGFLSGIGLQLMLSKLPDLIGIEAPGKPLQKALFALGNLDQANLPTLYFSLGLFALIVILNRHKFPGSLLAIAVGIAFIYVSGANTHGIRVVTGVQSGLPSFALPSVTLEMVTKLILPAIAIALVILVQSSAVIRSVASRFDEPVDDNRDLTALGFANIASALTGGFAINGSPPRTIAAEMSGGRTQFVNLFMALCIGVLIAFFGDVFSYLPIAALAVVIFMVGLHLFDVQQLKRILHTRRAEFVVALIALFGVALFGVQYGVAIAITTSIIERLRRQYRPNDEILLRDGRLAPWANERLDKHHKHRSSPPGVLAYRFNGSIFFENANYFAKRIQSVVDGAKHPVKCVVLDAGGINDLDFTAAETLKHVCNKFSSDDIQFGLAHVSPDLQKLLKRYHLVDIIGQSNIYPSLQSAIFDSPTSRRTTVEMVQRLKLPVKGYTVIGGGVLEALHLRETNDVDLVVSRFVYRHFKRKGWREYVQDDGKHVLSHNGYQLMESYVGMSLDDLLPKSMMVDGVRFMGIDDLLICKHRMGRKKDHEDVQLIHKYLQGHASS